MKYDTVDETGGSPILGSPGGIGDPWHPQFRSNKIILYELLLRKFSHFIRMLDRMNVDAVGDDGASREIASQVNCNFSAISP